jgi:hypothetical protein
MTLHTFQLLWPTEQLALVLEEGTYLAQRWDEESALNLYESAVNLYHCAGDGCGFFVEVGINDGRGQAVVLRSFSSSEPLDEYVHDVQLPAR